MLRLKLNHSKTGPRWSFACGIYHCTCGKRKVYLLFSLLRWRHVILASPCIRWPGATRIQGIRSQSAYRFLPVYSVVRTRKILAFTFFTEFFFVCVCLLSTNNTNSNIWNLNCRMILWSLLHRGIDICTNKSLEPMIHIDFQWNAGYNIVGLRL